MTNFEAASRSIKEQMTLLNKEVIEYKQDSCVYEFSYGYKLKRGNEGCMQPSQRAKNKAVACLLGLSREDTEHALNDLNDGVQIIHLDFIPEGFYESVSAMNLEGIVFGGKSLWGSVSELKKIKLQWVECENISHAERMDLRIELGIEIN